MSVYIYIYVYTLYISEEFQPTRAEVRLTHTHTNTHTHIYIYTHTYIHTYIHTYRVNPRGELDGGDRRLTPDAFVDVLFAIASKAHRPPTVCPCLPHSDTVSSGHTGPLKVRCAPK